MKRSSTRLAIFSFSAVLAGAPLAMAQAPKDAPHAEAAHPAEHAPAAHAEAHRTGPIVHHTAKPVVHKSVHVTEKVNEHVNKTVVEHTTVAHPVVVGGPVVHPGPGGGARWARGAHFDGPRVAYADWGHYHLRQPPVGYEWVQDGDELVLIDLGTGLIDDTFIITVP